MISLGDIAAETILNAFKKERISHFGSLEIAVSNIRQFISTAFKTVSEVRNRISSHYPLSS